MAKCTRGIRLFAVTLAKALPPGNADIPLPNCWAKMAVPILKNLRLPSCCDGKEGVSLFLPHGPQWEMAMSELKQQTIALWILLMLLIVVVPLALE